MIIRCPYCEHTRSITESKIPPTAELATCPKCKNRFRFRALRRPAVEPESPAVPVPRSPSKAALRVSEIPAQETQRPQSAFRESAEKDDIWDAMDSLHQRWQKQMDTNVTEVETPIPPRFAREPRRPDALAEEHTPPDTTLVHPPPAEIPAPEESPPLSEQSDFIFPYSDGGPNPEERVEQDMRMLRDAPPERPLRDLGMMREFPDSQAAENSDEEASLSLQDYDLTTEDSAIPWENPARNGWLRGFIATLHGVMFKGPEFFSGFTVSGALAPGYLFFLIMGYVTIIGSLFWTQVVATLLPGLAPMFMGRIGLPALLIAPIALGLMLLFVTGCIRITLRIFAPEQADFIMIYKVVSYAAAPFILSIAPFVGPPLGAVWFLVALITGCRNALGLSWPLAVLAPLPPALILLFGLARTFL